MYKKEEKPINLNGGLYSLLLQMQCSAGWVLYNV